MNKIDKQAYMNIRNKWFPEYKDLTVKQQKMVRKSILSSYAYAMERLSLTWENLVSSIRGVFK